MNKYTIVRNLWILNTLGSFAFILTTKNIYEGIVSFILFFACIHFVLESDRLGL